MREDGWRPWRRGVSDPLPGLAQVIGHRGAAARAPENTLAGLRKAHELGAGWVEFDVMLSSDGVPILIHDETLERTTSGSGRVDRHSAAEIQALDAGSWFDPAFRDERVPTLSEAVAVLLELNLGANVEIKPSTGYAQRTGEVVAALLQRTWPPGRAAAAAVQLRASGTCGGPCRRTGTPAGPAIGSAAVGLGAGHDRAWLHHPASGSSAGPTGDAAGSRGGKRSGAALHRQRRQARSRASHGGCRGRDQRRSRPAQ